jgi:hypothetical protein
MDLDTALGHGPQRGDPAGEGREDPHGQLAHGEGARQPEGGEGERRQPGAPVHVRVESLAEDGGPGKEEA